MADKNRVGQSFVAGPKGGPTREEAEKMAAALFDSVATERAKNARKADEEK